MSSFKMSYTIIHIPTKSSRNEIKSFVVVFIPHQLTLGRVIEHHRGHVYLMYDLSNGMILVQKIIMSSVLPVIEILGIKYHKLYDTFLHITFRSQSLLKPTSDQISSNTI
jgi:hypothetical protein